MTSNNKIQVRRATAAAFALLNPILADGEPGFETDTRKIKYGNGVSHWNNLSYAAGSVESVAGRTGNVVLSSSDIGNFSSAASAAAPVQSVNGQTGNVISVASVAGRTGDVILSSSDISNFSSSVSSVSPVQSVDGKTGNVLINNSSYNSWTKKLLPGNTQTLLHFNLSTNNTKAIIDSSNNGNAFSVTGDAVLSSSQSKFGGYSMFFPANSVSKIIGPEITIDAGEDFTIEAWVYCTNTTYPQAIDFVSFYNGMTFYITDNSRWLFGYDHSGANGTAYNGYVLQGYSAGSSGWTNTWNHVAFTRSNNTLRAFRNGTLVESVTYPYKISGKLCIGNTLYAGSSVGEQFMGYMDEFRIVKGQAKYTANFTPSAAAYSNSPISVSTAYGSNKFVTVYSDGSVLYSSDSGASWTKATMSSTSVSWSSVAYGNGTFVAIASGSSTAATSTDGITWTSRTLPSSTNWSSITYGNGIFVAISSTSGTIGADLGATSTDGITWTQRTLSATSTWKSITFGNGIFVAVSSASTSTASSSYDGITWTSRTLPSTTNWSSVAYGNNLFIAVSSSSSSGAISSNGITWTSVTLPYTGYSNIVYGNGYFVSCAVSSPTVLYVNADNTDSGFMDSSAYRRNPSDFTCSISTTQKYSGTSSLYFNNTALEYPISSDLTLGSGDFTVEARVYPTAIPSNQYNIGQIAGCHWAGVSANWGLWMNNDRTITFTSNGGPTFLSTTSNSGIVGTSGQVVLNTWNHVAVVRKSNVLRIFINGAMQTVSTSSSDNIGMTYPLVIGSEKGRIGNFIGYIDDVRITKKAVYTASFNPISITNYPNLAITTNGTSWSETYADIATPLYQAYGAGNFVALDGSFAGVLGSNPNLNTQGVPEASPIVTGAGNYSIITGIGGASPLYGQKTHSAGYFGAIGDAQKSTYVLRCKTTTNSAVEMALNGGSTYLTIASGKILSGIIHIVGTKSDGSAVAIYTRQFAIKNVGGTTTLVGTVNTIGTDTAAGTTISITANDTTDYLSIRPTGVLNETWRWVAYVDAVEVAYGT